MNKTKVSFKMKKMIMDKNQTPTKSIKLIKKS